MRCPTFILLCCLWIPTTHLCQSVCAEDVDYLRDIKPLLKSKCYGCHGALKQEGSLRLDTVSLMHSGGDSGPAIDAVNVTNSALLQRVMSAEDSERMPPDGEPLTTEQIALVRSWLAAGGHAPANERPQASPETHWAFQPVRSVDVPASDGHPIDAFIDQRLNMAGLQRTPRAKNIALIRRMFLDLQGLPPDPQQIDLWSEKLNGTEQQRTSALRQLIDELLASPRYGERWAQHWLDVVRYADTHGFEVNTPRPNAWPYRDYVIRAFNQDKPFDQFVFEQLAGDTVGEDAATGFMVAAAALLPGQIGKDDESKRLARQDELDEIIVGTTASFLGLTVGCARCHDHKFDPISTTDYYALQAFFAGVDYGERELRGADYEDRQMQVKKLEPEIANLKQQLSHFEPTAFSGRTLIIDDEDPDRVSLLKKKNGHGAYPEGTQRGYKDDVGDSRRFGNLSGGRYTWWDNNPGEDVFTWNPQAEGTFRLWISWGVHGSGVHTRDARYVLDIDGDLTTQNDQTEIARADQYYFVGQSDGESEQQPLWSGLLDTGIHEFRPTTKLILRGGDTGTGITADVIVLQEDPDQTRDSQLPQLRSPVDAAKTVERFEPVEARFVRFTSFATIDDNKHEPCLDELEVFTAGEAPENIALATHGTRPTSSGNYSNTGKHQLKHINDGNYGNSFSWISNERGKGWVQLEFPQVNTIDRIEWARDREGAFADRLPVRYQIESSVDGTQWTTVAGSEDRVPLGTPHNNIASLLRSRRNVQSDSGKGGTAETESVTELVARLNDLETQLAKLKQTQPVFAGRFREPDQTFVLNRGNPEQRMQQIAPHVLTSLGTVKLDQNASDTQRRTTLARWIASPENPLTARVIVNRIWQYHFGTGLVETASDFGMNSQPASHPELLDWLTAEFVANGWSIKQLHRQIMTSETYQQAASRQPDPSPYNKQADPRQIDAGNRLLWHFPSRRLEAEAIRDCMLAVSGQLNLKMGGPGFNFFKSRGGLSGFPPVEDFTANELRRMVFAHKIRMEPVPVFGAFDCPDAGLPTPKRSQSTTAIQALNLFNSPFVIDQASKFAERIQDITPDGEQQISLAFRLALGRTPAPTELKAAEAVVQNHSLSTLCRALFNSSEFLFLP